MLSPQASHYKTRWRSLLQHSERRLPRDLLLCLSAKNKSAEGVEHKHTGYGNPAPFIHDCIRHVLWAIGKLRRVNDSPRYLVLRARCIQHRFANDLPDRAAVKVLTEKRKKIRG